MRYQLPTQRHGALITAGIISVVNIVITTGFISRTHQILALQSSPMVRLPVAPPQAIEDGVLKITVENGGNLLVEHESIAFTSLEKLLKQSPSRRVHLTASPDVKYQELRVLLKKLEEIGVKDLIFSVSETKK